MNSDGELAELVNAWGLLENAYASRTKGRNFQPDVLELRRRGVKLRNRAGKRVADAVDAYVRIRTALYPHHNDGIKNWQLPKFE